MLLSGKANKLLFKDKRHQLFLYDVTTKKTVTLLSYSSFVGWVPDSDVIVAQNGSSLSVWYNIDHPDRVTNSVIKGDVKSLEKNVNKISVMVDEGIQILAFPLDERYIEFTTSMEDMDFNRALDLLETLDTSMETESMWRSLGELALKQKKLGVAEICYGAIGDVATVHYLRTIGGMVTKLRDQGLTGNLMEHFSIRAKLAILDSQFKLAETIYLENGRADDAMEMYQQMHKWDQSISVAEATNHPDLDTLKQNYFQWLLDSGQEERAAQIREENGDFVGSINLYLQGGLPNRAAMVLLNHNLTSKLEIAERIANALCAATLFEKAGDLYTKLQQWPKAFEAYVKGKSWSPALQLARQYFPQQVTSIELVRRLLFFTDLH